MKKLLFILPLFIVSTLWCAPRFDDKSEVQTPVYFPQSSNCFTLYNTGGGTQTAAGYAVYVSSIELVTTNGLNPGTTNIDFYDSRYDTVGEVITYINSLDYLDCAGIGSGWVATISQGCYDGNNSSSMTVTAYNNNVMTSTNVVTTTIDAIIGLSYTIPADTGGRRIWLDKVIGNATFGSGALTYSIYDGTSTVTRLWRETGSATTIDKVLNTAVDCFRGTVNTAMRIDLVGTAVITSAWLEFQYKKK